MNENSARRKLDKKLDSIARDGEGGAGNAKGFHKATRMYGKAIIDASLEEMAEDEAEAMEPCIMCGTPCVSLCCSAECNAEAIKIGILPPSKA